MIGLNYYITSERYLDEIIASHPSCTHGGNGRDVYADVEIIRAAPEKWLGPEILIKEAWDRYKIPLAVTEVHLNCTREQQLRWFMQMWNACLVLEKLGVEIKAITAWSLLGSFDWNSLITKDEKKYESGVFDVSENSLRPTAMAQLVKTSC